MRLQHADEDAQREREAWAKHQRLSDQYETEVRRLCALRGVTYYS